MIHFITGNANKFREISDIIEGIEMLDIDLPEIQETDAKAIIRAKLLEAMKHHEGEFIVEDTSLHLDCLNGYPGPHIKWLLKSMGNEGIYSICSNMGNVGAQAITNIGYAKSPDEMYFFEGVVEGEIIEPRGTSNFGWEPIFLPKGHDKIFSELSTAEKNKISMRGHAARKLSEHLTKTKR